MSPFWSPENFEVVAKVLEKKFWRRLILFYTFKSPFFWVVVPRHCSIDDWRWATAWWCDIKRVEIPIFRRTFWPLMMRQPRFLETSGACRRMKLRHFVEERRTRILPMWRPETSRSRLVCAVVLIRSGNWSAERSDELFKYEDWPEVLSFSSYRAVNTSNLGDRNQSGNAV